MDNEQLIHDYHNGRLSEGDKQDFETRLATNDAFAREVQEYRDVKSAIKENERKDLKAILTNIEAQEGNDLSTSLEALETEEETTSFGKRYRHIYVAAAVIIFAIIGFQFLEKEASPQDLYASYYQPYPNTLQPVVRGEAATDNLSKAFEAYEANDFEKAATLFDVVLATSDNPDIVFYKAMSLYNSGTQDQAAPLIAELKQKETAYTPQLYWYSALLALKNGNEQIAKQQLDSLTMLKSGYKKSAVMAIKKELGE